ncbi:MAG TPA: glycosyltransferase family 39 protein [Candidatus Saccharimonadales bacterium]|nr:glycosyltransferase family 39 protein [Candidatus Saccharimonadales bacterium]
MLVLWRRAWPSWVKVQPLIIGGLLIIFIITFYFWRLGSLTAGLGPTEYLSRQNSSSTSHILKSGINAPYHLVQHWLSDLGHNNLFSLRLGSVAFGLVILFCLFNLLRMWFGKTIATFALLIFLSTPWLVLQTRTASPDIMLLWPIVLLAFFIMTLRAQRSEGFFWILFCIVVALGIYTPGIIWFVATAAIVARHTILNTTKRVGSLNTVLGLVIGILILEPLFQAIAVEPSRAKDLFLIPAHWPPAVEALKSTAWSALSLFWRTRAPVDISIDRLPILNILQIALAVFGAYALGSKTRRVTYFLVGFLIFSILLAGLNQNLHIITLGLPAMAVFIAAGLRYIYVEWRRVFPLNPFAKALALGLIALVVGAQLSFSTRYTLVAWPHTAATKSTYVLK